MHGPTSSAPEAAGDVTSGGVEPAEITGGVRARSLLGAAISPLATGYAAVAALLTMVITSAAPERFTMREALLGAGPGWLAAYQVPLDIDDHPLSMLPLGPTLVLAVLIARTASIAAHRIGAEDPQAAVGVISTIAGAHAGLGLVISVLSNGRPVSADPLAAFLVPGLLAGLAAAAGVAGQCGILAAVADRLDPLAVRGLRAGLLGIAGLLAGGALLFAVATLVSMVTVRDLFQVSAPGLGGGFGMWLLCVGYLPNAVIGALAFSAGPGFSIGSASFGLFGFTGGPVPSVPLLAAVPEHPAPWWPALLALPALAGLLVGWSVRRADPDPVARLRIAGIAAVLVGFGCVLLGTIAGGKVGAGQFDPVAFPLGLLSVAAFGCVLVPSSVLAWFAGPRGRRPGVVSAEPAPAPVAGPVPEEKPADLPDVLDAPEPDRDSAEGEPVAEQEPRATEEPEAPVTPDAALEDPAEADPPDQR